MGSSWEMIPRGVSGSQQGGGIHLGQSPVQASVHEQSNKGFHGVGRGGHGVRCEAPAGGGGLGVGEEMAAEVANWLIQGVIRE